MANTEIDDTAEIDLIQPQQDEAVAAEADAKAMADAGESPADAASSTATDVSKPGDDILSVVQDVVSKRKETPAASSAKAEEPGQETGAQPTKDGDDDYSDVPFNKHPRFQHLLRERNDFKVDAQRYRNVQSFLDREGLSGEDAANGLTLLARSRNEGLTGDEMADGLLTMALAKTNPAEAWKRIKPWVQKVIVAAGEWLPDDLQERVQRGELSADAALEVSRSRAVVQSHEARQSFAEQQAAAKRERDASAALANAANEWAAERQTRDPGFEAKLPALMAEVQKLQQLGWRPSDPAGVKEQLRRAYAAVNGAIRTPAPAPTPASPAARPAVRPVTGGQVAGTTSQTPQTTMDHVNAVLARRRQAG